MELTLPIFQDLTLSITDKPDERKVYPTARLQKGLRMNSRGLDLTEEAVGFGLPVLKQGLQTIFPGSVRLDLMHRDSTRVVTAIYSMNLVEKIGRPDKASQKSRLLYAAKNTLAAFIRRFPLMRTPLTVLSSGLRGLFGWETTYEEVGFRYEIRMIYTVNEQEGILFVETGPASYPLETVTELIIMNEQGAHFFDQYRDSSGARLSGKEIGCWDEVSADEASFASSTHGVAFYLPQVAGARLYRGRELVGSRLAWAGFGYSHPAGVSGLSYTVRFEKLP
jgi:hypothetical protein